MHDEQTWQSYRRKGFAARGGYGYRPALLAVDLMLGFTDPASPLGADLSGPLRATAELLALCRARDLPVAFTTVVYETDLRQAPVFLRKVPALKLLLRGSEAVRIDPAIAPAPGEMVFEKQYASAFFGTALHPWLQARQVDTLLITGCTTSGCVRATAVDALQHDYHTIVVEDGVGDRAQGPHEANLLDLDAKYADVVPQGEAMDYLRHVAPLKGQAAPTRAD